MTFVGFYDCDIFDCPSFRMLTLGDCPRANNILNDKRFEPESMRLWCQLAKDATSIIDIGAHVGVYALAAASIRKDIPIHAFEPNPYAYSRLREHKLLNGFTNLEDHPVALADRSDFMSFGWLVRPDLLISSGGALLKDFPASAPTTQSLVVKSRRLSEFRIPYGDRPLVKIDVEGAEYMVLRGANGLLKAQPDIIIESFNQANCDRITEMLWPGYSVFKIIEDGRLEPMERLTAADGRNSHDFNQFVTWNPSPQSF